MRTIQRLIYLLVLFQFLYTTAYSANHYIDKNANGLNNGSSWTNAWESFSAINWGSINPGDIIYISGGTDSTMYYETLDIKATGTLGNEIVITPGNDTGHNGVVIIDGQATRDNNILISGANTAGYVKIDGQRRLKIVRGNDIQALITVGGASRHLQYVTIEGCLFSLNEGMNGDVRMVGSSGTYKVKKALLRNSDFISTPNPNTCDRVVFFYTEDIWIDNNFFYGGNTLAGTVGYCHDDCIQSYFGNYSFIISNNYFYDGTPANYHQIIMLEDMDGTNVVYNNVVYMPNKLYYGNTFLDKGDGGIKAKYIVIHNTLVSGTNRNQFSTGADTMIAYNNLFTSTGTPNGPPVGGAGISFSTTPDWTQIQANFFGEKYVEQGGWNNLSMTQMNSLGAETFGTPADRWRQDPLVVNGDDSAVYPNEDFRPTVNSPLRDAGKNVQSLVESIGWAEVGDYLQWVDIDGNPRDDTPDIGAYQYGDPGPDLTPPRVIGAALQDSVTLVVSFSETLDEITAENVNNYSITNNINVINASLSGSKVTLQTSAHSPGSYVVTVVNVKDLVGNPIAQNNTADYILLPPDTLMMFQVQNVEGVIIEPEHTPLKTIDELGALDGDPHSRWSAEPMPEELIFDLGTTRTVCKTKLSFYNWNAGRVYNYSISISNDHNNWTTIIPQGTSASNEEWTVDEFSPVDARYILVHFINNNQSNWAGLWEGEIWGIDGGGNNPPNQPSNPNPSNGATNQQLNLTLSWTCTDPDGDPLTYDVYFGTNSNPPIISTNQSSTIFNPVQLVNSTNYYWKIVAKDNQGATTTGPVWSFTTVAAIVNNPPYPPSNPVPGNGTSNQPTDLTLTWNCTDPDGDPLNYDVYFGTIDEPPLISTNHSNPSFNPGMLNNNTTYYWKIVARDNQGATTSGLVWNFSTVYIDVTPPEIVNAELLDSVTLKIWFSEPLAQSSAQNISNYSINNGIQVLSASLSGSEVTLTTAEHNAGSYIITVINVKDLAGNQITPPNNTDQYEYSPNPTEVINLELKIFLDGSYINNSMTTDLSNNSLVPFNQPYSGSPWNYYGNETVSGIPQNTVDWILLELRTNTSASSIVSRRAAFLRSDGIIVDLNGNNQITFPGVQSGSYYVVVYHRNHLAIMTKTEIQLSETSSLYDFTNSQNKAYGTQPMKSLGGGNYGLYAADGNANGNVNNSDNSSVWRPENGSIGYKRGDFDLNGGVTIVDKNEKWKLNKGKISYVPTN